MAISLRRALRSVGAFVLAFLLFPLGASAVANPDSISIGDVYFFQNCLEEGDILCFVRYDVSYASQPSEDPKTTFQIAIYTTTGIGLYIARPLNYYQHNIISIYLSAEDNMLTWGSAYYVRVMGNPAIFTIIEGITMDSRGVSSSSYKETWELGSVMTAQAEILEADWGVTLLDSSDKLNDTGSYYFLKAVEGLSSMVPEIFETTAQQFTYTRNTSVGTGGLNATKENMPTSLNTSLNGLDDLLGITNDNWGQFGWFLFLGLIVGGVVYAASRRPDVAVLGGVMGSMGLGAYLGVAQGNVLLFVMAVGTIIVVLFAVEYIIPRYG